MNHKLIVAVLYGGKSTEHEVSVHSATTVCKTLQQRGYEVVHVFINKQGYWFLQQSCSEQTEQDIALTPVIDPRGSLFIPSQNKFLHPDVFFPVLHGSNGEDGTVQGLLECMNVPYVGCGVLASSVGMDKEMTKRVAKAANVATLAHLKLSSPSYNKTEVENWASQVGYPVFVKPMCLGSSVGVTKVKEPGQLHGAIAQAFRFDSHVLVEKGVEHPQEIFCGLLGKGNQVQSSECGELKTLASEFFDYEAKYITVGGCETRVPADLPEKTRAEIRQGSERIFKELRGTGLARADFFVDSNGKAWFSEINTIPGLSETSLYPQLFEAAGICYADILDKLIAIAQEVYAQKKKLSTEHVQ